jgi:hypothetical protein
MNVVICSAFRNAGHLIENYFNQVDALANLLAKRGDWLSLVLGYGDSEDGTGELLFEASADSIGARLVEVSHGGQAFGSIVNAQRFKQLAYVGNKILANVPDDADAVIWLESDLIWAPEVIAELLNHLQWHACVAPMIMDSPPATTFYDTWAFRRTGMFAKQPPHHASLMRGDHMVEMDSVGSCVVMRADAIKGVTVPEEDVLVGVCRQIKAKGGRIFLDTKQRIYHP